MTNYINEMYKEFDQKSLELRASGKKGILIGGIIFEDAPESFFRGDKKTVEKMAEEWKAKGGHVTIYSPLHGSEYGLKRDPIYIGMEFELCANKEDTKKAREDISSRIYRNGVNFAPGLFVESDI